MSRSNHADATKQGEEKMNAVTTTEETTEATKAPQLTREEVIAKLVGFAVAEKTETQLIAEVIKRQSKMTDNASQIAVIAYVLIEHRGFKTTEAAKELDYSVSTISAYSNKGKALVTAKITETVPIRTAWAQLGALAAERVTSLCSDMVGAENPAQMIEIASMTTIIAGRLGDLATPEKIEAIRENLVEQGIVLPARVRAAVAVTAKSLEITLPAPTKRESNTDEKKAETAPTTPRALTALVEFEQDRMEGSDEETPFDLSPAEVADLVKIAITAIRQLNRAGKIEAVIEIRSTCELAVVTAAVTE